MKSLFDYIQENEGGVFSTPSTTMGMGNPGVLPDGTLTEPIVTAKCKKEKRKKKKVSESILDDENTLINDVKKSANFIGKITDWLNLFKPYCLKFNNQMALNVDYSVYNKMINELFNKDINKNMLNNLLKKADDFKFETSTRLHEPIIFSLKDTKLKEISKFKFNGLIKIKYAQNVFEIKIMKPDILESKFKTVFNKVNISKYNTLIECFQKISKKSDEYNEYYGFEI